MIIRDGDSKSVLPLGLGIETRDRLTGGPSLLEDLWIRKSRKETDSEESVSGPRFKKE